MYAVYIYILKKYTLILLTNLYILFNFNKKLKFFLEINLKFKNGR